MVPVQRHSQGGNLKVLKHCHCVKWLTFRNSVSEPSIHQVYLKSLLIMYMCLLPQDSCNRWSLRYDASLKVHTHLFSQPKDTGTVSKLSKMPRASIWSETYLCDPWWYNVQSTREKKVKLCHPRQKTDAAAVQLEPRKERRCWDEKYQRRYVQMGSDGFRWVQRK